MNDRLENRFDSSSAVTPQDHTYWDTTLQQNIEHRFRKIHLDFHTPAWVEGVGEKFDKQNFARTLLQANVDNICVFAKCCHGLSYYDTNVGVKHPHLRFDLLGEAVGALRGADMKVSIYYSVVWDDLIVDRHEEWAQRDADGNPRFGYGRLWRTVCVNSPYADTYLLPQVKEIVEGYNPDELWFDMVWVVDEECFCGYCRAKMIELNLDPGNRENRRTFSDWTDEHFIGKVSGYIKKLNPDVRVTYNNCVRIGARRKIPHMHVFEIESLPHAWGYWYFPLYARYLRTLGIPVKGMTCRFHKFWGDFGSLKPVPQMQFEAATMLAQGAGCVIGDQLDPSGVLEPDAYANIGEVFGFIKEREEYSRGWKAVTEVGLFADDEPGSISAGKPTPNLLGALKLLMESHIQFDVVDAKTDLSTYTAIVIANTVIPSHELRQKLSDYLAGGGRIFLTGDSISGAGSDWQREHLGIVYLGPSDYSRDYLRPIDPSLSKNLPAMDLIAYDRFHKVLPEGGTVLAEAVHPLAERTPLRYMSHLQASPGKGAEYPGAVGFRDSVLYFAPPLFKSYFESGNTQLQKILSNGIGLLVKDPLIVTDAPPSTEVTLLMKGEKYAVHIVNYSPSRRGNHPEVLDEIRPLRDVTISVRLPDKPVRVYSVPGSGELGVTSQGSYARVVVPEVQIHTVVVFEM